MRRSKRVAVSVGAALVLCGSGLVPAWAHNQPVAPQQVRGLVTGVVGGTLHVQTASGGMAFSLSSTTRITRIVTGTTADLASGESIHAQFVAGTDTIRSIRIEMPHANHGSDPSGKGSHPHDLDQSPFRGTRTGTPPGKTGSTNHPPTGVFGQIVSMTSKTVTIKGDGGQTATYTLSGNVMVSKVLPGKVGDLAMGETVLVCTGRGNATSAVTVTILSS